MGRIGVRELVLVALVVLIVFGSRRLPELARSLGKSARILKSETAAMRTENAAAPPRGEEPAAEATATPAPASPQQAQRERGDRTETDGATPQP